MKEINNPLWKFKQMKDQFFFIFTNGSDLKELAIFEKSLIDREIIKINGICWKVIIYYSSIVSIFNVDPLVQCEPL
jgi:hypothetical protein